MTDVTRIEPIDDPPGGWIEFYSSGKIQAKDSSGKMIKHERNFMPTKTAKELGQLGAQKALDASGEIADLLEYLGLSSPFDKQLASILVDGKGQSVQAAKELLKASQTRGSFKSEHKQHDIKAGKLYMANKGGDGVELEEVLFNEMGMQRIQDFIISVREERSSKIRTTSNGGTRISLEEQGDAGLGLGGEKTP